MNRRLPVLALLVALVAGAFAIDWSDAGGDASTDGAVTVADVAWPIASDPAAVSSTWFCAGGTADEEAFADHVITVLNPTASAMRVTITVFPGTVAPALVTADVDGGSPTSTSTTTSTTSTTTTTTTPGDSASGSPSAGDDEPVVRVVDVPSLARRRLALSAVVSAPVASAVVESTAGGLVVEHEVTSIHGYDAKPCATEASDQWHFAWGTTERDARELLVLFNPFPADAIVDGRFSTEDGVREPGRFDGLVVPARSTLAVDLGDDVTRRAEVAASITTRTGRIVVDRIVRLNEPDGDRGLTVQLGVARPLDAWVFPDGFLSETVAERYAVYNPGPDLAEVEITFALDRPDENGVPEPIDLSLAPGAHAVIDLAEDGRIPLDVGHAATVRSANAVPVVAERIQYARETRDGVTVTTGSPVEATEWYFAAGSAVGGWDEVLVVYNDDPQVLAEVDVFAVLSGQLVPVSEMQGLVIEAGQRSALQMGERIPREELALVVRSSEPVVVERGLYRVGDGQRGASNAVGVPAAEGARLPTDPLDAVLDPGLGTDLGDELDVPADEDAPPTAPDDVELPEPDETIVIEDPDAPAETTTTAGGSEGDGEPTSTTSGGVPDTTPTDG